MNIQSRSVQNIDRYFSRCPSEIDVGYPAMSLLTAYDADTNRNILGQSNPIQLIVQALMVAFCMIMLHEFGNRAVQRRPPNDNNCIQALFSGMACHVS